MKDVGETRTLTLRSDGQVSVDGGPGVHLTRLEARLLLAMARRQSHLSKDVLLLEMHPGRQDVDMPEVKIVDVMVCKLRNKLREVGASDAVATVWGMGYRLDRCRYSVALPDGEHLAVPLSGDLQSRLEDLALARSTTVPLLVASMLTDAVAAAERSAWA